MSALLIVDDEQAVLNALAFLFRGQGYTVFTADCPKQALALLASPPEEESIGVVISDYRMPGMSGTQFLQQVSNLYPDIKRILLTAKCDIVSAMDAVNEVGLYRFLFKPCSHELLIKTLKEAFAVYDASMEIKRLNRELQLANDELRDLNSSLENRIDHATRELREVLYFDRLTGLPSKELLMDRLEFSIRAAKRSDYTVTVIHLGLENFRLVNETLGHQAGNLLMCELGERLNMYVWDTDSVGRMQGDQFCMVINHTDKTEKPNEVVSRLLGTLQEPFEVEGRELYLNANLGISMYPGDGASAQALFDHAEAAMHQAKKDPDIHYRFYSEELHERSSERFLLQSQVRQALHKSEFKIYYQPRINTSNGSIVGVEALLRWQHPERGLLPPDQFLPVLEETGLIGPVGEWLLNEVCHTVVQWCQTGDNVEPFHVAVNVSPIQLKSPNFLHVVQSAVEKSRIAAHNIKLELEITENVLLSDIERVKQKLHELRNMGIKLAIDDFGTGYSSLSYLIMLPIHYLKIDRAFVIDITHNKDAKAIVQAITSLASSLRMQVVAEGIETTEQLDVMHTLNCEEFQGFLFSRPLPEKEMRKLIQNGAIPVLADDMKKPMHQIALEYYA